MNSDAAPSVGPDAPLDEVLDRLDVVIRLCFDRLDFDAVLETKVGDELTAERRVALSDSAGSPGRPSVDSPDSQATSTRNRSRIKANSEKMSRSSAVCRP